VFRVHTSGFADVFRARRITVFWVITGDDDTLVGAAIFEIAYTSYVVTVGDALRTSAVW